jgi:hypothetical protein
MRCKESAECVYVCFPLLLAATSCALTDSEEGWKSFKGAWFFVLNIIEAYNVTNYYTPWRTSR